MLFNTVYETFKMHTTAFNKEMNCVFWYLRALGRLWLLPRCNIDPQQLWPVLGCPWAQSDQVLCQEHLEPSSRHPLRSSWPCTSSCDPDPGLKATSPFSGRPPNSKLVCCIRCRSSCQGILSGRKHSACFWAGLQAFRCFSLAGMTPLFHWNKSIYI